MGSEPALDFRVLFSAQTTTTLFIPGFRQRVQRLVIFFSGRRALTLIRELLCGAATRHKAATKHVQCFENERDKETLR